jgi:hypothetical protein
MYEFRDGAKEPRILLNGHAFGSDARSVVANGIATTWGVEQSPESDAKEEMGPGFVSLWT